MNFKDKVIWITGASSGIGEYMAYAFSEAGARLVLSSRKEAALLQVREKCAHPEQIMVLPLDVTNFNDLPAMVQAVSGRFERIDILVNNAGVSQRAYVLDTRLSVDQQIMDINYFGSVALTKAVLPLMVQQQSGQIVVISSVLGKLSVPARSAYAASKHALHGYFNALRAEIHDHQIGVTIICPGYVHTNVSINALTGDGSPNAKMADHTANGFPPDVFARKALRAIAQGKNEIVIARKEKIGIWLYKNLPNLYARFVRGYK